MPKWETVSGSLRRLAIWLTVLACWETAYRTIQWRAFVFPAPSHILDATLAMLNVDTRFGEPMGAGWPMPRSAVNPTESEGATAYHAGQSPAENPYEDGTRPAIDWARGF